MAKSKAVQTLLATAIALASTMANDELQTAIDNLDALEDATHSNSEYKALKVIVDKLEDEAENGDGGLDDNAGDEQDETLAQSETQKTQVDDAQNDESDADAEPKQNTAKKALKYAGVKMIGAKWYCVKDGYKKGFATADECADHYNG